MTMFRTSDHDGSDIGSEASKMPADDLLDCIPRRPSFFALRPKGSQLDSPGRSPRCSTKLFAGFPVGFHRREAG